MKFFENLLTSTAGNPLNQGGASHEDAAEEKAGQSSSHSAQVADTANELPVGLTGSIF